LQTTIKKAASRILLGLVFPTLFTWAAWAATFTGPKSKYYLANPSTNMIYVVQGTRVVASFPMAYGKGDLEGALAVSETIRTRADDLRRHPDPAAAGEYTLAGDPTGNRYDTPYTGDGRYYDGASDGVHNYFVDHGPMYPLNGGVYRTDYFWQNPEWLFYPQEICNDDGQDGCHGLSGIAYDPRNNSLWISGKGKSVIGDYSLDGVLLAIFDAYAGYNAAVGVDPADHTLWVTTSGTNLLRQYSLDPPRFGQLLQYGVPTGLPYLLFESGEFKVVQCSAALTITSLSAAPDVLWPPDHRMVPVKLKVTTSGGCGDVTCRIASVTSSEPTDRTGDWIITGDLTLNLQAERLEQGSGRLYGIGVQCTDTFANRAEKSVKVIVPHEL